LIGIENGKLLFTSNSEHLSLMRGVKQRLQFDPLAAYSDGVLLMSTVSDIMSISVANADSSILAARKLTREGVIENDSLELIILELIIDGNVHCQNGRTNCQNVLPRFQS